MVIAILAILIGLLLPTVVAARRRGAAVVCMSNIRQLAIGSLSYAADYGRLMPYSYFDATRPTVSGGTGVNVRWCWSDDTPGEPLLAFRNGMIAPYLKNVTQIAGCPAYDTPGDIADYYRSVNLAYPVAVDYGYNSLLLGLRDPNFYTSSWTTRGYRLWIGFQLAEIKQPSTKVMFADAGQMFMGRVIPNYALQPAIAVPRPAPSPTLPAAATVHGRHPNKTANIAWVDGHVTAETVQVYANQTADEKRAAMGFAAPYRGGERSNEWLFVK